LGVVRDRDNSEVGVPITVDGRTLFSLALIWLATALGLAAKSVETASNTPMFLTFLPFLGSGFVLAASMPTGLRQFAHYQPFTPATETLRGLPTGTPIGTNAIRTAAWSTIPRALHRRSKSPR
jgi:ABC-2 type transport system permease protein